MQPQNSEELKVECNKIEALQARKIRGPAFYDAIKDAISFLGADGAAGTG